jgi:purine-nucleoside phosphorylase
MTLSEMINTAADYLRSRIVPRQPEVGVILGSGLGKLADEIEEPLTIPYGDIPGFPVSTAIGHKGNFIVGRLGGKCIIAMQGRIHYYEGYEMSQVVLPVRVMVKIGIRTLFVSNAAGGTNLGYHVGDLMIIRDHINLIPNPLIGPNLDEFGPRFPDMTRPYDPALIRKAEEIAAEEGIPLRKGVYVAISGPSYETPAEYRYFRQIGADAVGMSTTPEVIVARHSAIPVFGMSVITDVAHATDDEEYVTDGEAIVQAANAAADRMTVIFRRLIASLPAADANA